MNSNKKLILKTEHKTFTGKRKLENEDSLLVNVDKGIFIIADGMSGWNGKNASSTAIKAVNESLEAQLNNRMSNEEIESLLRESLEKARRDVIKFDVKSGTTIDVGIVHDFTFHFAHIGDSRIYALYKNEYLEQITEDMTQSQSIYFGRGPGNDIENKILSLTNNYMPSNWIGHRNSQDKNIIHFGRKPLMDISRILMATDGLTDISLNDEIRVALSMENLEDASSKFQSYLEHPSKISETFITHLGFFLENHIKEKSVLSMLNPIFNQHNDNPNIWKMSVYCKDNQIADSSYKEFLLDHFDKHPDIRDIFISFINDKLSNNDDTSFIIIEPHIENLNPDPIIDEDGPDFSLELKAADEIGILNNKTSDLISKNKDLLQELDNQGKENKRYLMQIQELENRVKLEQQTEDYNESINILEKTNGELNSRLSEKNKQFEEYKAKYSVSKEEFDELKKQLDGLKVTLSDSKKYMNDYNTLREEFENYKSKEQDHIDKAKREYEKSTEIESFINKQLEEKKSELENKYSELEKQNQKLSEKIFNTEDELLKTKSEFTQLVELKSKYQYTKEDFFKINGEKIELERSDIQKTSELQKAKNEVAEIKDGYEKIKDEKEKLEEADKQKTSELRNIKGIITEIKTDYEKIKNLEQKIENLLESNKKEADNTGEKQKDVGKPKVEAEVKAEEPIIQKVKKLINTRFFGKDGH